MLQDHIEVAFTDQLKQAGLSVTPQRVAVWRALFKHKHMSAEEIHQSVNRDLSFTNPSTIYRTIDLLTDLGLVRALRLKGRGECYEAQVASNTLMDHAHLVCSECGEVSDLFLTEELRKGLLELAAPYRSISNIELTYRGDCRLSEDGVETEIGGQDQPSGAALIRMYTPPEEES